MVVRKLAFLALVFRVDGRLTGKATGAIHWSNHPELCLEVTDGFAQNGNAIQLASCRDGAESQHFFFDKNNKTRMAAHPNFCIDIRDHLAMNGNFVQVWECIDDDADQSLMVGKSGYGPIRWSTHNDFCLDVRDHSTQEGTAIQIWRCLADDSDQSFTFGKVAGKVPETTPAPVEQSGSEKCVKRPGGSGTLRWASHPQKCLDVKDGAFQAGGEVQIWDCVKDQKSMQFAWGDDCTIRLASDNSLCLGLPDGKNSNGDLVEVKNCRSWDAGQRITIGTTNHERLILPGNKCLDVKDHLDRNGNRAQVWECLPGDEDQFWSIGVDGPFQAPPKPPPAARPDIRVAKGHYSRGYDSVRFSVISSVGTQVDGQCQWDINHQFKQKWFGKQIHSRLLSVGTQGVTQKVNDKMAELKLPAQGQAVKGLVVSDPCVGQNQWCSNGQRFRILEYLSGLINRLIGSDEFHFLIIAGDNFYDSQGGIVDKVMSYLSDEAKSKVLLTVPGNHDFWINGAPPGTPGDQFGYGWMQFWAQDSVAALSDKRSLFDFSSSASRKELPHSNNFIIATQIGDIAFFGWSGAHDWIEVEPEASKFCAFAGETSSVHHIVLLGHWDKCDLGCKPGMDVPAVREKMKLLPGCDFKTMIMFMGHTHCNVVTQKGNGPHDAYGFMIGAAGMAAGCLSEFGVAVVESIDTSSLRVDYLPVVQDPSWGKRDSAIQDNYDGIMACLKREGTYEACRRLYSKPWREVYENGEFISQPTGSGGSEGIPIVPIIWGIIAVLMITALFLAVRLLTQRRGLPAPESIEQRALTSELNAEGSQTLSPKSSRNPEIKEYHYVVEDVKNAETPRGLAADVAE